MLINHIVKGWDTILSTMVFVRRHACEGTRSNHTRSSSLERSQYQGSVDGPTRYFHLPSGASKSAASPLLSVTMQKKVPSVSTNTAELLFLMPVTSSNAGSPAICLYFTGLEGSGLPGRDRNSSNAAGETGARESHVQPACPSSLSQ